MLDFFVGLELFGFIFCFTFVDKKPNSFLFLIYYSLHMWLQPSGLTVLGSILSDNTFISPFKDVKCILDFKNLGTNKSCIQCISLSLFLFLVFLDLKINFFFLTNYGFQKLWGPFKYDLTPFLTITGTQ